MATLSEDTAITDDDDFLKYLGREQLALAKLDGGTWSEAHKGEVNELIIRLRDHMNPSQITNAEVFIPYVIRRLANKISRKEEYPHDEIEEHFKRGVRSALATISAQSRTMRGGRGLPFAVNRRPESAYGLVDRRKDTSYDSKTVRFPTDDRRRRGRFWP